MIFARLTGRNGSVREYPALVAPTSEYCVIPKVDAFSLGYTEAATGGQHIPAQNALHFVTSGGYGRGTLVQMARVDVGAISARDVDFVTYDMQQAVGYDVVLGGSFLEGLSLEVDYPSRTLKLGRAAH